MRRRLLDNLKNIPGWRTSEKLVVFSVDDYGNVRLDSADARERLGAAGINLSNRFDKFDALETKQDLEALMEVLSSVSDASGRAAVFTPYALCANPDFNAMHSTTESYAYEPLPRTFERLSASQGESYSGAWSLWHEGIQKGLLKPQFHGREHLNIELLERKLRAGDPALTINLENQSMAGLNGEASIPSVGFTQAFAFRHEAEVGRHREIIEDGLALFKGVFGFASCTFTPPSQQLHPDLYEFSESLGIRAIDKPFRCVRRIDNKTVKREWNTLSIRRGQKHVTLVRNVVFEPTNDLAFDSVAHSLDQIAAAFRWRRPAIVSSHRVNFCGHIDPSNRETGLDALKRLLDGIVNRWPDVQFLSADELADKVLESV